MPSTPNWRARLDKADVGTDGDAIRAHVEPGGEVQFSAISAPWVRDASAERGYAIELRVRVLAGEFAARFADDAFRGAIVLTPTQARLPGARTDAAPMDDQWHEWRIEAKRGTVRTYLDDVLLIQGQLAAGGEKRRLPWGTDRAREASCFLCKRFCLEASDRFRYPTSRRGDWPH